MCAWIRMHERDKDRTMLQKLPLYRAGFRRILVDSTLGWIHALCAFSQTRAELIKLLAELFRDVSLRTVRDGLWLNESFLSFQAVFSSSAPVCVSWLAPKSPHGREYLTLLTLWGPLPGPHEEIRKGRFVLYLFLRLISGLDLAIKFSTVQISCINNYANYWKVLTKIVR